MNWQSLVPLASAAFGALVGGFIVHFLTARRDRANKRREQKVDYLIEIYRRLEVCVRHQPQIDPETLESAFADIQLFGSGRQVELVKRYVKEFPVNCGATFDSLLSDMRNELRKELGLEVLPNRIAFIKFNRSLFKDQKPE